MYRQNQQTQSKHAQLMEESYEEYRRRKIDVVKEPVKAGACTSCRKK